MLGNGVNYSQQHLYTDFLKKALLQAKHGYSVRGKEKCLKNWKKKKNNTTAALICYAEDNTDH